MKKISLAISCFIPLYLILLIKNAAALIEAIQKKCCCNIVFNAVIILVWLIATGIGVWGIIKFIKDFLKSQKASKKKVKIISADNVTSEYYFTYFSLFVISFFAIDSTRLLDVCMLAFLMLLIIIVYVKNDMYFINPVLNILGYKSFVITVKFDGEYDKSDSYSIKVFSTQNLSLHVNEECYVKYGQDDFTVCERIDG